MPSMRYFISLVLAAPAIVSARDLLAGQNQQGNSETCPAGGPLSCHNTTAVSDLCCFNAPGGALLQTQFWDTAPAVGPSDSWTIHGLWPDNCDGTYDANCDPTRAYTNITDILQSFNQTDLLDYMDTYWLPDEGTSENFWEHEWGKHGTCISTLDPDCYTDYVPTEEVSDFFNKVVALFKNLPTYTWLSNAGIVPSSTQTYTLSQIQSALQQNYGYEVYLGCSKKGTLDEVWYFYNVQGSVQAGNFEATDSLSTTTCPSSGIKYLPKPSSSSASTGGSLSGSGALNVQKGFH